MVWNLTSNNEVLSHYRAISTIISAALSKNVPITYLDI